MLRSLFGRKRPEADLPPIEARIPDGQRVYAVGDIHGRADLLGRMAELIAADIDASSPADVTTVFLGDYVDRGPDSSDVIEQLAEARFPTPIVALLGNHEQTLLDFLRDEEVLELWRTFGGLNTLFSYGVKIPDVVANDKGAIRESLAKSLPEGHRRFFGSLRTHYVVGDYFFCHAGIRPGVALDQQSRDDLIWIREPFLSSTAQCGKLVVHGHTPAENTIVRANRIGIDTGAFATGRLTCVRLERDEVSFIEARL